MTGLPDEAFNTKNPPEREGFFVTKLLRGCEINRQTLLWVWIKRLWN